jgi:hypothetical protein
VPDYGLYQLEAFKETKKKTKTLTGDCLICLQSTPECLGMTKMAVCTCSRLLANYDKWMQHSMGFLMVSIS